MEKRAAVITVSDKGARGERVDTSGPAISRMLMERGIPTEYRSVVPDEEEQIRAELLRCSDELRIPLILTTGGTGFSPRDVTPEATKAVLERETPGIPEAMRAESMRITPRGCLSRETAGIRGGSLIVNLPGSEKAVKENLAAVLDGILHGLDMLASSGSADCGEPAGTGAKEQSGDAGGEMPGGTADEGAGRSGIDPAEKIPSMDAWMKEAKADASAPDCGMYLFHNGVVRQTAKALVRGGGPEGAGACGGKDGACPRVTGMQFSYDREKAEQAVEEARNLPGIHYVRVWLNQGQLKVGDDIMLVLVGGDIRPHVIDALQTLVGRLKTVCVTEEEIF